MLGKATLLFGLLAKVILEKSVIIITSALLKGKALVVSLCVDDVRYVEMTVIGSFYDDKIYSKDHLNIYILTAATLFLVLFTHLSSIVFVSPLPFTHKSPLDHLAP